MKSTIQIEFHHSNLVTFISCNFSQIFIIGEQNKSTGVYSCGQIVRSDLKVTCLSILDSESIPRVNE